MLVYNLEYPKQSKLFSHGLDEWHLSNAISGYRERFLKRKNINGWKRGVKGTPGQLDKLINQFDRKINGIPLFDAKTQEEYFSGLNDIFIDHYLDRSRLSRKDAYVRYQAVKHIPYSAVKHIPYSKKQGYLPFKEFVKQGLTNFYR